MGWSIANSVKDVGYYFAQCMTGICLLATHSYQLWPLKHKMSTPTQLLKSWAIIVVIIVLLSSLARLVSFWYCFNCLYFPFPRFNVWISVRVICRQCISLQGSGVTINNIKWKSRSIWQYCDCPGHWLLCWTRFTSYNSFFILWLPSALFKQI